MKLFENYDTYTENEIVGISKEGISLKSSPFINYRECTYNFKQNKFIELISKENTIFRFQKFQKQIFEYGYSTRDLS